MTALLDSHLHLYREELRSEAEAVLARSAAAGVRAHVHVGYTRETNELAQQQLAGARDAFATAGLHPHDALDWGAAVEAQIRELAESGRIIAVGECGLDYFRDLSPRSAQAEAFRAQIRIAKECDLPMIHHVRDAYPDARAILEDEGLPPRRGIFHAFAGDAEFARWAVGEGYRLGIGGPITYPNSQVARFLAELPLDSLQLETDAPWLPPQPWRGQRNEPAYARIAAERIAELHSVQLEHLARSQAEAFESCFRVKLSPQFWNTRLADCPPPSAHPASA